MVIVLVVVSFGLMAAMFVRDDSFLGVIGLLVIVAAGPLSAWYAVLAG